jgi:uncharacterized protein YjbI with pentapeptide repeats
VRGFIVDSSLSVSVDTVEYLGRTVSVQSFLDINVWVIAVVLLLVIMLGYWVGSQITGFGRHVVKQTETLEYTGDDAVDPQKEGATPKTRSITKETQSARTIWDWMTVVTISAVIAFVAISYSHEQAEQQQDLQDQQAKDDALQAYVDQMTLMLLDDKNPLLESERDATERVVARVRTVTAIKRLEGEHNRTIITFLKEAGLIAYHTEAPGTTEEIVRLTRAPLRGVDLSNNGLAGVDLRFVNLRNADLHESEFDTAHLAFANLAHADLRHADLRDTALLFTNLVGADLRGANLTDARLVGADLRDADLRNTKGLTPDQLDNAGAGDDETRLREGLKRKLPSWWTKPKANGRPPEALGATLKDFDTLNKAQIEEIGIPTYVTTGAVVYDVVPGSAAANGGLLAGDIIHNVAKKQVRGPKDVQDTLQEKKQSSRVRFAVFRYYGPRVGPQDRDNNSSERVTVQGWRSILAFPKNSN